MLLEDLSCFELILTIVCVVVRYQLLDSNLWWLVVKPNAVAILWPQNNPFISGQRSLADHVRREGGRVGDVPSGATPKPRGAIARQHRHVRFGAKTTQVESQEWFGLDVGLKSIRRRSFFFAPKKTRVLKVGKLLSSGRRSRRRRAETLPEVWRLNSPQRHFTPNRSIELDGFVDKEPLGLKYYSSEFCTNKSKVLNIYYHLLFNSFRASVWKFKLYLGSFLCSCRHFCGNSSVCFRRFSN